MYGITYKDEHSYRDYGVRVLNNRTITPPTKRKVIETVPFMNGSYDFSNLYNGPCFDERIIEYTFLVKAASSEVLECKKMQLENWLLNSNEKTILEDDNLRGYYYTAECTDVQFEEMNNIGKLKATFTAYPFKIRKEYEGYLLWDDFNFELDLLQETTFTVNGSAQQTIDNQSVTAIAPIIICSSEMVVIKDGVTYNIPAGTLENKQLEFKIGKNDLTIIGEGTIEFRFKREVL